MKFGIFSISTTDHTFKYSLLISILWAVVVSALLVVGGPVVLAAGPDTGAMTLAQKSGTTVQITLPIIDPKRGQALFVTKGCVMCHSVNGVGGRAGPALDSIGDGKHIDILDFSARMWRGAFAMIELQGMELGYQLDFTGEELGHIVGFLYDKSTKSKFSADHVPDLIRDMFIREPYSLDDGLKPPPR